ncbi:MAG: hypothetical protein PHV06_06810 [bacterium]|nr:hypothetical protein [bacterium]
MENYIGCIQLTLAIICPVCNGLIPVNGPVQRVKCLKCGTVKNLKGGDQNWKKLFYLGNPTMDLFKASQKYPKNTSGINSIKLNAMNRWPKCLKCKYKFEQKDLVFEDIKKNQLICPECKTIREIYFAPAFIKEHYKSVLYIVDGIIDKPKDKYQNIITKAEGNSPITFQCSSCGANLEVDGTQRVIQCRFCGTGNFISDKLWVNISSPIKVKTWYILFDRDKAVL